MDDFPSITPLMIYDCLDKVNSSSGKTMEVMKNNAMSILFYKEIMNFSSEELINLKNQHGRPRCLFTLAFNRNDPLIFAALIKKGVGLNKLEPYCAWLIETFPDLPLNLCETIYNNKHMYNVNPPEPEKQLLNFLHSFVHYLEKNQNSYSQTLLDSFYDHFHNDFSIAFLKTVVNNIISCPVTTNTLINKIQSYGHDLNEGSTISLLLPDNFDAWKKQQTDFIIEPKNIAALEKLFQVGFSPHINYLFNRENLFKSLIKSNRFEQIEKLLPYLSLPFNHGTIEEDKKMIESLVEQPTYGFIRATYFKALFDHLIEDKVEPANKTKLKI